MSFEKLKFTKEEKKEHYSEGAEINGLYFSVCWDKKYNDYTIYFPEMELKDKAREKKIFDNVLIISKNPETAKKVFDFTKQAAQQEEDVYKLYKMVEVFILNLQGQDEEDEE